MTFITIMLNLVVILDLEVEQMNVKIVFFHDDLEEENCMKQPDSFQVERKKDYRYRLSKYLLFANNQSALILRDHFTTSNK